MKKIIAMVMILLMLPMVGFAATKQETMNAYISSLNQVISLLMQEVKLLQKEIALQAVTTSSVAPAQQATTTQATTTQATPTQQATTTKSTTSNKTLTTIIVPRIIYLPAPQKKISKPKTVILNGVPYAIIPKKKTVFGCRIIRNIVHNHIHSKYIYPVNYTPYTAKQMASSTTYVHFITGLYINCVRFDNKKEAIAHNYKFDGSGKNIMERMFGDFHKGIRPKIL